MDFAISEDCIGVGTYGTVYGGHCKTTGEKIVYKKCTYPHGAAVIVRNEVEALQRLSNSEYVISILAHDDMGIILPRYNCSLDDYLKSGKNLSRNDIIHIISRIAMAIHDNKDCGIIHRDIKPDNILLNMPNDAVLADYGLYCIDEKPRHCARLPYTESESETDKSFYVGTMHWRAPELLDAIEKETEIKYDHRIDVWSLGLIFLLLVIGHIPAADAETNEETLIATEVNLPILLEGVETEDPLSHPLIKGMLHMNPDKRFTIKQVLTHPALEI